MSETTTEISVVQATETAIAPVQQQTPPSMFQAVMAAAMNPALDPDRIKAFLEMAREIELEQKQQEFNRAFAAAHRVISRTRILKNGEIVYPGKAGKPDSVIRFAKHEDLSRVIKPALEENGLVATFTAEFIATPPKSVVVMVLLHQNGISREWRSVPFPMVDSGGGKNDMQGSGSVSTYGRRYVIMPAFDIVAEGADDDGSLGASNPLITDEQALGIEDILSALEDRQNGKRAAFLKWIAAQFKVEKISDLKQGEQLDEVRKRLDAALKQAGLK